MGFSRVERAPARVFCSHAARQTSQTSQTSLYLYRSEVEHSKAFWLLLFYAQNRLLFLVLESDLPLTFFVGSRHVHQTAGNGLPQGMFVGYSRGFLGDVVSPSELPLSDPEVLLSLNLLTPEAHLSAFRSWLYMGKRSRGLLFVKPGDRCCRVERSMLRTMSLSSSIELERLLSSRMGRCAV